MKTKFSICTFLLCLVATLSVQSNETLLIKGEISEHNFHTDHVFYTEFITCLETAEIPGESRGLLGFSKTREVTNEYPSNDLSVEIDGKEHTFYISDHWQYRDALFIGALSIDDRIFQDNSVIRKVVDPILESCPSLQARYNDSRSQLEAEERQRRLDEERGRAWNKAEWKIVNYLDVGDSLNPYYDEWEIAYENGKHEEWLSDVIGKLERERQAKIDEEERQRELERERKRAEQEAERARRQAEREKKEAERQARREEEKRKREQEAEKARIAQEKLNQQKTDVELVEEQSATRTQDEEEMITESDARDTQDEINQELVKQLDNVKEVFKGFLK